MTNNPTDKSAERRREERRPGKRIGMAIVLTSLAPNRPAENGELVNVSSGGMAVWLPTELPAESHWLLSMPDLETAVPGKILKAVRAFGGFVHSVKFSSHQDAVVARLGA